jgi:hypothetical protein
MNKLAVYTAILAASWLAATPRAEFSPCHFNFGMAWQGNDYAYPSELDCITIWAGSDEEFNQYWHGAMLRACQQDQALSGVTPVYYSYIIAFTARRDWGLKDCNMGEPNLCQRGARYIREQRSRITGQYEKYADATARIWGTDEPIIWLMEPDYVQYADHAQQGGALSWDELGELMHELATIVKSRLPNAVISMDISPWINDQSGWFSSLTMSDFAYMNTSGGQTEADNAKIRSVNHTTWNQIYTLTGKGIIADDGYGLGGGSTGHDHSWDDAANINARIADGVIGIMQANPRSDWGAIIASLRPRLDTPLICAHGDDPSLATFSLGISATGDGTVTVDPMHARYDSGEAVTLSAIPMDGATFIGWDGDLSGDETPVTLNMDRNRSIVARFTQSGSGSNELIRNGDFSNGSCDWTFGAYESALAAPDFSGGQFSSATSAAGDEWRHIQLSQDNVRLEQGRDYALVFQAAADRTTTMQVNIGMSASPWSSYCGGREIDLTSDMRTFTIQFPMQETTDNAARVEFNAGLSPASWRLDNVSLSSQISTDTRPRRRPASRQPRLGNGLLYLPQEVRGRTIELSNAAGKILYKTTAANAAIRIPATIGQGVFLVRISGPRTAGVSSVIVNYR